MSVSSSSSSAKPYDFYSAKRFKADSPLNDFNNTNSTDGSIDDLNRSLTSSPDPIQSQMPLNSIANKLSSKNPIDFATAYNGLSSAAQNYYSNNTPQNYENYYNYNNQYNNTNYHTNTQYPIYPAYNFQNRGLNNVNKYENNRSSLGNTSSSADSSSVSLNSPSQINDENSPLQGQNQLPQNRVSQNDTSFNLGSNEGGLPLKKRRPTAVQNKDNSYWEKRRKNNESAKRSRDMRRCKEEHISVRVIYLEQDNLQLRTECTLLRSEVEKLRAMLYANTNQ